MEYRYFFKSLFLVLLLALSIWSPLLYFNVVVDPYGVFLKSDIHFPGTANRRHIKINYLLNRKDQYDSFIFGSSRVNCFDPEKFRDGNFYNMTYNAGVVNEHLEDINYLIKKGVKIKKLIIAIDYLSLLEPYSNPYQYLARKKYPETFIEKIDFYKSYLLNKPDMDFVKNTLGNSFSPWRIYMNKGIMESDADMLLNANIENHQLKPAFLTPSGHYLFNYDYTNNIRIIADLVETAKKNNIE